MRIKLARPLTPDECRARFGNDVTIYREVPALYLTTDTREVEENDIFVALTGEKENGANFLSEAVLRGAAHAITANGLSHLTRWARQYKEEVAPKTIAVTGSVGKSSVKEMLRALLSGHFLIHVSEGNYNTEIGILLTVLSMPEQCEILVAEAGARHMGDIAVLSRFLMPDIGIITAIGHAHIGMFGSIDNVRKAKFEIAEGMGVQSTLFLGIGVEPSQSMHLSCEIKRLSKNAEDAFSVYAI